MPSRERSRSRSPVRTRVPRHDFSEGRNRHENYKSAQKIAIPAIVNYLQSRRITFSHNDVFKFVGVQPRSGWSILKTDAEPATSNDQPNETEVEERRGRNPLLSQDHIIKADRILQSYGEDSRTMTWTALAEELELPSISEFTMKKHLGSLDFRRCITCGRGWQSAANAKKRVEFAKSQLQSRPEPMNWFNVRFSDEVHFGWTSKQRMHIVRKPGERHCPDCILHEQQPDEKDMKQKHAWAAVGISFKSSLVFYSVPGNSNGKITQPIYRDSILEPYVGEWLRRGDNFVLEEEEDSGHGMGRHNIARTWKQKKRLHCYFNCTGSPDLTPIESCWAPVKEWLPSYPRNEGDLLVEATMEGWDRKVTQEHIDMQVLSMPQRFRDCIHLDGQFIGY